MPRGEPQIRAASPGFRAASLWHRVRRHRRSSLLQKPRRRYVRRSARLLPRRRRSQPRTRTSPRWRSVWKPRCASPPRLAADRAPPGCAGTAEPSRAASGRGDFGQSAAAQRKHGADRRTARPQGLVVRVISKMRWRACSAVRRRRREARQGPAQSFIPSRSCRCRIADRAGGRARHQHQSRPGQRRRHRARDPADRAAHRCSRSRRRS